MLSVIDSGCSAVGQVEGGCGSSRQVSCQTLKRTLVDFGVLLCDHALDELCAFLDRCGDGQLVVGDLFDIIRPRVSPARAALIETVYRSIDTDADGCISLTDVMVRRRRALQSCRQYRVAQKIVHFATHHIF